VAQQKADRLGGLLSDELSKRGKPTTTPWQQHRLLLRPTVPGSDASFTGSNASPGGARSVDVASVDTLQQQRSKLKPVQTSSKVLLPVKQQPAAAIARQDGAKAAPSGSLQSTSVRNLAPTAGVCELHFCSKADAPVSHLLTHTCRADSSFLVCNAPWRLHQAHALHR